MKGKVNAEINNNEKDGILSSRDMNNSSDKRKGGVREVNNNVKVEKDAPKDVTVQPKEEMSQEKQVKNPEKLADKDWSNDTDFKCQFCDLKLNTDRQLANHYLTSHSGKYTLLTCAICEAQVAKCKTSFGLVWRPDVGYYTTTRALNVHISLAHPSEKGGIPLVSPSDKAPSSLANDSKKGFRQPVAKKRTGGSPLVSSSKKARKSLDSDTKKASSSLASQEKKARSSLDNPGRKSGSFYKTFKDLV